LAVDGAPGTGFRAKSLPPVSPTLEPSVVSAAKGSGIMFASKLVAEAARFAAGILLARFLGAQQLGLYSLAVTVAAIASGLALLGMRAALVRYVSLFAGRRDEAGLWGTIQIGIGLPTVLSLLAGAGLMLLAEPLATQAFHEPALAPLLRIGGILIPILALGEVLAAATRGFKKMQYTAIAKMISRSLIRLILIAALALTIGLTVATALTALIAATAAATIMLLLFLNELFPLARPLASARREPRSMLRFGLPVYASSLLATFGPSLRAVLLGALSTIASVGIFAVATQINSVGRLFHGSVVSASAPLVSELHDQGDWVQMKQLYQTVTKWSFTVSLPLFLVVVLFPAAILSVFGKEFVAGVAALTVLAWANLVRTGTGICGVIIDMTGNTSLRLANSLIASVLIIALNILLIPQWGLLGAAVASLVVAIAVNTLRLGEVFFLFRMLPYNLGFLKPVTAGLMALIVAWAADRLLTIPQELVQAAIASVLLFTVYIAMLLLLRLSDEDRALLTYISRRAALRLSRRS